MTDRANIFADVENVGQLYDALWYNAVSTTLAEGARAAKEEEPWNEGFVRRAREIAVVDAHKRYQELTA